jgi:HSP20 family protein
MNLVRWEPFRDLMTLRQAMDRVFEESFVRPSRALALFGDGEHLPIDMYQTPDEVVVKASLPGVKPEDVDINIADDILTIKGKTNGSEEVKGEDYLYREHHHGSFVRSINIPHTLQTDKAEATAENGVLTITIPRAQEAKPKTIEVKAKKAIEGKKKEKK